MIEKLASLKDKLKAQATKKTTQVEKVVDKITKKIK